MPSTFFFSDGSTITSSNTTITSSSYNNQKSTLISANIGNEATAIGNAAFSGCTNLTTITLPNGLGLIDSTAFYECTSLNGIIIPNNVTIIRGSAFKGCTSLSTLILGSRVSIIDNFAFENCSSLITLTIPASVTSIGSVAFGNCSNLTTLVISNGGNLVLSTLVFRYCTSLTNITIGNSLKILSNGTFLGCSSLNTINIPNHVTSISTQVFQDCSNLATVTIGTGVTSIGAYAFIRCTSLVNINIPNGVTIINDNTFYGCTSLTNVTIPDSVTTIQIFAFGNCSSLININVGASNVNLSSQDGILFNKNKTTIQIYPPGIPGSYVIPNSVTTIKIAAFASARLLTSITIPNSVKYIEGNAFGDCTSLTDVIIPNSVIGLGYSAFLGCTNLKTVTVSSNIPDIQNDTFSNCTSLTRVNFLGNAPSEGQDGIFNNDSNDLKVYRYSTKSGWNSTFGGRTVLLIDSPIDRGLQTFGFPNISSGKILIKKQNVYSGKMSLYKTPPKFLPFGVPLLVTNLPFDENAGCNFSVFNRTWIYLGAPSFRYRPTDTTFYHILTPLTPEGYGGNGSYKIISPDEVYFTNSYNNSDKFPSNNWQLTSYMIDNCPQSTTLPIFTLPNPNAVIFYEAGSGNPLQYSGDGLSSSHFTGYLLGGGQDNGSWTVTFKIKKAGVLYYSFNLESEGGYDYASSNVNGNTIFAEQSGYVQSNGNINVNIDDIITITYYKDSSVSEGFDGIGFDFYIV